MQQHGRSSTSRLKAWPLPRTLNYSALHTKKSGQPVALKTPHIKKTWFCSIQRSCSPDSYLQKFNRPTTLLCQQSSTSCRAHPLSVNGFTLDTVRDIGKLRPAPPVCGPNQIYGVHLSCAQWCGTARSSAKMRRYQECV